MKEEFADFLPTDGVGDEVAALRLLNEDAGNDTLIPILLLR